MANLNINKYFRKFKVALDSGADTPSYYLFVNYFGLEFGCRIGNEHDYNYAHPVFKSDTELLKQFYHSNKFTIIYSSGWKLLMIKIFDKNLYKSLKIIHTFRNIFEFSEQRPEVFI